jgi:pyroglutamyl-peptidase
VSGPAARHVLLTGFEPFGGDALNPSQEIAKTLDGRTVGGLLVRALVLPVEHERAREALRPALAAPGLAAVLHLGLAGGRARIAVEQVGVNVMDYPIPDGGGRVVRGEACLPGEPAAHLATLPIRPILAALAAEGVPAYLSYTAGTYLCNFTLYTTLHALAASGRFVPAGFVHLPFLPAMVAAHGLDEPSMDLPLMLRAVEIALGVIAHDPTTPGRSLTRRS